MKSDERHNDNNITAVNSTIDKTAKIYKDVRVTDSTIHGKAELADFSRIYSSKLEHDNRIGRSSLIYHSTIGKFSYTGSNTVIMYTDVGSFSSISWNVTIGPANHDHSKLSTHDFLYNDAVGLRPEGAVQIYDRFVKRTRIGNDVWIGAGAVLLNGVTIGDGAVIGANATVTKDVEPYAIVVGSPARVVAHRFSDEIIAALQDLRWWEFDEAKIKAIYPLLSDDVTMSLIAKIKEI